MPIGNHCQLTPREVEVVGCLLRDLTIVELAEELVISLGTGRTHVRNIPHKTGTRTIHGIVEWAHDHIECCAGAAT